MTSSDLQASPDDLTSLYSMMQAREVSYLKAKQEVEELSLVSLDQHEFQYWILHPENLHFSQLSYKSTMMFSLNPTVLFLCAVNLHYK